MTNNKEKTEEKDDVGGLDLIRIGTALESTKEVFSTSAGTKMVCIRVREDNDKMLYSFALPNGKLFEVEKKMIPSFFNMKIFWHIPELYHYEFVDREQYKKDVRNRIFNPTWK